MLLVLLAGCGKPAAVPEAPSVPVATTQARSDADGIYQHYWRKAPLFEPHPAEGKRLVVAVDMFFTVPDVDSSGAPCLITHAYDGVKRPQAVYRLVSADEFKPLSDGRTKYIEGTLRGAVPFADTKFAAKWESRAPHTLRMPDHFVFLDECRAVQP